MVALSAFSCHSRASARRRISVMLGQVGLLARNAAKRGKRACVSEWRRMNHSASFCPAGSAMVFAVSVASSVSPSRARSIAFFSTARAPVSAGTHGFCGMPDRLAFAMCGLARSDLLFGGDTSGPGFFLRRGLCRFLLRVGLLCFLLLHFRLLGRLRHALPRIGG